MDPSLEPSSVHIYARGRGNRKTIKFSLYIRTPMKAVHTLALLMGTEVLAPPDSLPESLPESESEEAATTQKEK